jgi:hypothetical protein
LRRKQIPILGLHKKKGAGTTWRGIKKGAKTDWVDILNRNGRRSYTSLEKAMNNWCSAKTIERFLKSQPDYLIYSQNVRPLLSEGNRLKQVAFSKHVQDRWGLGAGKKILWTMR